MKREWNILTRYIIALIIALPNLFLFYFIFTPLTIYPVFFLLSLIYNISLFGNILLINSFKITLVEACIAGSAYYLLIALNLTTPMQAKKRIYSLIFLLFTFLLVNIVRIFLFTVLLLNSFSLFNLTHLFFWYVLSTLIVVVIWLINIKLFNIKEIPVYSDLNYIVKLIKKRN